MQRGTKGDLVRVGAILGHRPAKQLTGNYPPLPPIQWHPRLKPAYQAASVRKKFDFLANLANL